MASSIPMSNAKIAAMDKNASSLPTHTEFAQKLQHAVNALAMLGILAWDVIAFQKEHRPHHAWYRWFGFLSRWTLLLVTLYLTAVACCAVIPRNSLRRVLWHTQSVALPASIAVVPLYWGQIFVPEYRDRVNPLSAYFVHGVNALVMVWDFALSEREWRFSDAKAVLVYGLINMAFMFAYFHLEGCPKAPSCDLDMEGHPYVYSVVDWRYPRSATLACLGAIFVPVPLLSLGLEALSGQLGHRRRPDGGAAGWAAGGAQ